MDAQQFLAEFGHIANAPGGVQQLREMVCQLAITGALTPRLDTDGDARQLLADIATLKERLIHEKKYKRLSKLESEALDIPPYIELPASWCWTRLLDIGEISPRNDAPDEAIASFIPMSGFSEIHRGALAPEVEHWGKIKKGFTHFKNGDVVVAKITPCFENGKAAVIEGLEHDIGAGTTELHVFRSIHTGILPGYVYLFLRSPYFAVEGEKNMTGTAGQKRLPTEYFATRALPLPPSAEQTRIVAKVDELMALCDKLEAQQQSRRKLQNNLRLSTLQAVASATSPHELQTTWARLSNNFGRLFHAPEDVADLRSLVLDLAVHGFLTEQSEDDTNAIKTFEDIKAVEKRLVADKNLGRPKPFQPLQENDIPFSLPNGWIWTRLGELAPDFQNGISKRHGNTGIATTVLRLADILKNQISLTEPRDILLTESERDKYLLEDGDILITRVNGSADLVGSFILVNAGGVAYCDHFIRLRFVNELIDVEYVWVASQSPFIRQQISGKFVTTAGQKTVNQNHIGSVLIPLPPIQEQHRIVKRVAELMRLCDSMESQLRHAKEVACRHAISAVSSLTGIAIGQEEEPMKAPQTELIASLRLGAAPDIKVQAPLATILARHNGEMSAKDLWRRFGGEIEAFYAQLKTEVAHGWILEPAPAEMREKPADAVSA